MVELLLDWRLLSKHVFHEHSLTLSGLFFSDVLPAPFPPPRSFPRFPFAAALSNIKCDSKPQVRWVTTECGEVSVSRRLNNKQWFAVFFHSSGSYGFPQFLHIAGGQGKWRIVLLVSCTVQPRINPSSYHFQNPLRGKIQVVLNLWQPCTSPCQKNNLVFPRDMGASLPLLR